MADGAVDGDHHGSHLRPCASFFSACAQGRPPQASELEGFSKRVSGTQAPVPRAQRVNTLLQARFLAATAQSRQSLVRGRASPQMPAQQGTIGTLGMQPEHRSSWEVGGGGGEGGCPGGQLKQPP